MIRNEKRMSIEALAVLAGIDEEELCKIESGTSAIFICTLFSIADELNVDYRRILVDYNFKSDDDQSSLTFQSDFSF